MKTTLLSKIKCPKLNVAILCGGKGTRMTPLKEFPTQPKSLIKINNTPILLYIIKSLQLTIQLKSITIICPPNTEHMFLEYTHNLNPNIITQHEPLGSAHATLLAIQNTSEPILIVNGDSLNILPPITQLCLLNNFISIYYKESIHGEFAIVKGLLPKQHINQLNAILPEFNTPTPLTPSGCYFFTNPQLVKSFILSQKPRQNNELHISDTINSMIESNIKFLTITPPIFIDLGNYDTFEINKSKLIKYFKGDT